MALNGSPDRHGKNLGIFGHPSQPNQPQYLQEQNAPEETKEAEPPANEYETDIDFDESDTDESDTEKTSRCQH